jgi:hypothetical protein
MPINTFVLLLARSLAIHDQSASRQRGEHDRSGLGHKRIWASVEIDGDLAGGLGVSMDAEIINRPETQLSAANAERLRIVAVRDYNSGCIPVKRKFDSGFRNCNFRRWRTQFGPIR